MSWNSHAISRLRDLYRKVVVRNRRANAEQFAYRPGRSPARFVGLEALQPRLMLSGTAFEVDVLTDVDALDGVISLREALYAANNDVAHNDAPAGNGADTITFDADLFIGGAAALNMTSGVQFVITDDLVIEGPGSDLLTIDALGASRVFVITDSAVVSMDGLTITNGDAYDSPGDDNGGNILIDDSMLTLTWSTVSYGYALGGGGICNAGGTLTVDHSYVINNTTADEERSAGRGARMRDLLAPGGGMLNTGDVDIINSEISGNYSWMHGGGVGVVCGTLDVINSTIADNTANKHGGGIACFTWSDTVLANSIIAGNSIEHPETYDGHDLYAQDDPYVTVDADHTLIQTSDGHDVSNGVDGNIVGTPPSFVNTGLSNFRLSRTSVAIDAGDDGLAEGTVDLDSEDRFVRTVDMGAYEYQPHAVDRHVFYNDSYLDGYDSGANYDDDGTDDDDAIDTSKDALLPGDESTFANVTGYDKGLNGVMVDLYMPGDWQSIDAADFDFKTGTTTTPGSWGDANDPDVVAVRPLSGDTYRVTLIWDNNDPVEDAWLKVIVKANDDTGLASDDVFYFGNLIGETDGVFNGSDELEINYYDAHEIAENHSGDPLRYDINVDGTVDSADSYIIGNDVLGAYGGDADLDGTVYLSDLAIMREHYGASDPAFWTWADFNADDAVNATDLAILKTYWGQSKSLNTSVLVKLDLT